MVEAGSKVKVSPEGNTSLKTSQQSQEIEYTKASQAEASAVKSISRSMKQEQSERKKVITKKRKHKITAATIWFSIFVVAWAILATIAAQYITAFPMYFLLGSVAQEPAWTLVYYILTYALTLTLVILVPPQALKIYRRQLAERKNSQADKIRQKSAEKLEQELAADPTDLGVQHLPTFVDIGLAPVGYVIYIVLAAVLTSMMSAFAWFNADQSQSVGFGYYITDIDRILAMIAVVFIAPIAEELVMRGWLYGKLRRKWNIPVAMLIVSLTFAVLHGQWNVGVSVFALSMVMCTLREITGTIWSGMLLHILSNGIAFYLLYVAV